MRLGRYARPIAFLVLAVVSAYGLYRLFAGDWTTIIAAWRGKEHLLIAAGGLGVLDVAVGMVSWIWIYRRFGVRTLDGTGLKVYLAGYAGVLLPMKLGNLIRPDAFARLDRGSLRDCIKAEAVLFFLDAAAALAIIVGLGTFLVVPLASPIAVVVVIALILILADRLSGLVSETRLALPRRFWCRGSTVGILLVRVACWSITGTALYVLISHLAGEAGYIETLFFVSASSVVGAGTGLPGGIGAIEGLLGVSLDIMKVPPEHFAFAVGAFRLATFWIWLPIGWVALLLVNRQAARRPAAQTP